ncbi:MAG TPA: cell division protein ZapA [Usitatibacteraceae bacterium]|nr:cell division protein ZapA [Usitatibacteraceae bacterium]
MSDEGAGARDKGFAIQLLGREFRVACPEGEELQLQSSVEFLNRRMKELRDSGKVTGNERIAIMAALNIAHEYLSKKPAKSAPVVDGADYQRRIAAMQETLESALAADQDKLF